MYLRKTISKKIEVKCSPGFTCPIIEVDTCNRYTNFKQMTKCITQFNLSGCNVCKNSYIVIH